MPKLQIKLSANKLFIQLVLFIRLAWSIAGQAIARIDVWSPQQFLGF